ncbi:MAG: bifunctional methylenetetrahydrofolate dehydrogenase/methenyltetrahydrofolate cyclohydrolase FolD [Sulfobacillus benefaciens]|uniref:Bifunctional protein FolD n=1 Tax=Sulfobacillus benefaciens TaxID=453960 RepID=A0A2T2XL76_9FIRM|nr:MAG: bifunctional methylenetetrahydrofolate dehydrogenase/methenyltetrahydrofolate cyclohydrolase FolD [Sulfobacillus benefaciens]
MANILDGKLVAAGIRQKLKGQVEAYQKEHQRRPGLEVVLVGDDPASHVYVRNKERACAGAGIVSETIKLAAESTTEAVIDVVDRANRNASVHGILVQMPLPPQIDTQAVLSTISPDKDVDGLTSENLGRLAQGKPGLFPCTPRGVIAILDYYGISLVGRRALVVGRSLLVGKPLSLLMLAQDATVTIAHSRSRDLDQLVAEADIVVAAVGRPQMIRGEWIKDGAVVIDVGINRTPDGLVGDVAYQEAVARAKWITPVPGGVGPMTIAMLLDNTWQAFQRQERS